MEWIVGLIDARAPAPKRPGPKPGKVYRPESQTETLPNYS